MNETNYWLRYADRRLSRRKVVGGMALTATGLAALGLVGCGDDDDGGQTPGAQTPGGGGGGVQYPPPPRYSDSDNQNLLRDFHWSKIGGQTQVLGTPRMGGVFVVPTASFGLRSLHPDDAPVGQWPFTYSHSNLLGRSSDIKENPDLQPITTAMSLSESYEQPDAQTLIFKLKRGVKWHDIAPANGAELTVDDIRATFDFFKKSPFQGQKFASLSAVEETSPGTIRLRMSQPASHMINLIRAPQFAIMNARHIAEGEDALKSKAIGTGPFSQGKFSPETIRVFKKNPNFFEKDSLGNQLPYLDGVVQRVIADPAAAVAAFRTGQVDVYKPVSVEEFNRLRQELDTWAQVMVGFCGCSTRGIVFSHRDPLFKDPKVRQAFNLAIDHQDITDTVFGGAATMRSYIPWFYNGQAWPKTLKEMGEFYAHDVAKAKSLLSAAGVQTPRTVELYFVGEVLAGTGQITGNPYVESVQRDLKQIGINVELKTVPRTSTLFYEQGWNGLFASSTGSATATDSDDFFNFVLTGSPLNGGGLSDAKIDATHKKLRETLDNDEKMKLNAEIDKYISEEALLWGLLMPDMFQFTLWRKYAHNLIDTAAWWISGGGGNVVSNSWLDDKAPSRNIDSF
jgi:peptide/nickel transport system substrate-binding protein